MTDSRREESDRGARLKRLAHPSRVPDEVPCPHCGGPSDLDVIDLTGAALEQHCPACGHSWRVDLSR